MPFLPATVQQPDFPVVMRPRQIGPATAITGGKAFELSQDGLKATFFIPDRWTPGRRNPIWMHFHTADWFVVQEYQRARIAEPLIVFNFGQGSTVYGRPFATPGRLEVWVRQAEQVSGATFDSYNFTSFSAGYGAVRNLISEPDVLAKLRTVILADSMYASLDEAQPGRAVLKDHVRCWDPLRDRAVRGRTTWIVTTSQITPPTYAGTWEVALALVDSLGGAMRDARQGSSAAASEYPYRLLRTYERGKLTVWSYDGQDAAAHMTHPRRLAELLLYARRKPARAPLDLPIIGLP